MLHATSFYSQLRVHNSLFTIINDDSMNAGGHYNMDDQPFGTTPCGRRGLIAISFVSEQSIYNFSPNRNSERLKTIYPMMKMRTAVINVRSRAKGSMADGPLPPTLPHKTVR